MGVLAEIRARKAEKYEDSNLRTSLGLDALDRRLADRVIKYARTRGFERGDAQWFTFTGLRILEESAAIVLEHLRDDGASHETLRTLGELMARWCSWGIHARKPITRLRKTPGAPLESEATS